MNISHGIIIWLGPDCWFLGLSLFNTSTMLALKTLFTSAPLAIIAALSTASSPIASRNCHVLAPGQYTIATADNGWLLQYYSHAMSAPGIISHAVPPVGQRGVWELTNAPQAAYYIRNVGENANVTVFSNYGRPMPITGPAEAFAIQCAGGGTYVIKNPVADELWTAAPDALVNISGANGDITQRFLFALSG
jgi:hypothetical protein